VENSVTQSAIALNSTESNPIKYHYKFTKTKNFHADKHVKVKPIILKEIKFISTKQLTSEELLIEVFQPIHNVSKEISEIQIKIFGNDLRILNEV